MKIGNAYFLAALAFLLFGVQSAGASARCHCEMYFQFVRPISLTEEFVEIGARALNANGSAQSRIADLHQIERLRILANAQIPSECRSWVADRYRQNMNITGGLFARGEFTLGEDGARLTQRLTPNLPATERASNIYTSFMSAYSSYLRNELDNSSCARSDTACRAQVAYSGFAAFSSQLPNIPGLTDSDRRALGFYFHVVNLANVDQVVAEVRARRDGLSEEEYLTAVQLLGIRGGSVDYNFPRGRGQGPEANGFLDRNRVLTATANNLALGWDSYDPDRTGSYEFENQIQYGGVCRDVAVMMARLLEAKGFHNVQTIGYEESTAGHATVIAESYTNPGQYHLLNYGQRITRSGRDGSDLLNQSGGDFARSYRVYDAEGVFMGYVPSTLELVLNEAAGMNNREWFPLSRTRGNLVSGAMSFGPRDEAQVQVFAANDGNGVPLIGAGTTVHLGNSNSILELRGGGVAAVQSRNPQNTGDAGSGSQVLYLHIAAEGFARTPRAEVARGLSLRGETVARILDTGHFIISGDGTGASFQQPMNQFGATGEIRYRPNPDGVNLEASAGIFTGIRVINIQGGPLGLTSPQGRFRFAVSAPVGPVRAFGEGQIIADRLGPRGSAEVGVVHRNIAASVGVSGRLNSQDSLSAESSLRRVNARVQVAPTPYLRIGGQVSAPLESTPDARAPNSTAEGLQVQGTIGTQFKQTRLAN